MNGLAIDNSTPSERRNAKDRAARQRRAQVKAGIAWIVDLYLLETGAAEWRSKNRRGLVTLEGKHPAKAVLRRGVRFGQG